MSKKSPNYCSFCGKRDDEVERLIAGPTSFICDECIELCHSIVLRERAKDAGVDLALERPAISATALVALCEARDLLRESIGTADRVRQVLDRLERVPELAQAGEAGTAETRSGSVHEHAVPEGDAP